MKPERFLAVGLESLLMPLILQALQIVPARPGLYPKKWILCTIFCSMNRMCLTTFLNLYEFRTYYNWASLLISSVFRNSIRFGHLHLSNSLLWGRPLASSMTYGERFSLVRMLCQCHHDSVAFSSFFFPAEKYESRPENAIHWRDEAGNFEGKCTSKVFKASKSTMGPRYMLGTSAWPLASLLARDTEVTCAVAMWLKSLAGEVASLLRLSFLEVPPMVKLFGDCQ